MNLRKIVVLLSVFMASISLPVSANESIWDRETEPHAENLNITVFSSPSCTCCEGWIEHLQKHGFQTKNLKTDEESIYLTKSRSRRSKFSEYSTNDAR